jgi:subtilisin family serine protease
MSVAPRGPRAPQAFIQEGTIRTPRSSSELPSVREDTTNLNSHRTPAPYQGVFDRQVVPKVKKHTKNAVRIAILDTGFDAKELEHYGVVLCPEAYDAFAKKEGYGQDDVGHGTAMALIAARFAGASDYCIIGIKALVPPSETFQTSVEAIVLGLTKALEYKADIISMSYGANNLILEERDSLQKLSAGGAIMFAAAGNDRVNLDEACVYFPACYKIPGLIIIGAQNSEGQKAMYSNYGSVVNAWFPGEVQGLRGTSVSTAIAAGKYAKFLAK